MKSTIYKIAALTFAVASMSACSLDEYIIQAKNRR